MKSMRDLNTWYLGWLETQAAGDQKRLKRADELRQQLEGKNEQNSN